MAPKGQARWQSAQAGQTTGLGSGGSPADSCLSKFLGQASVAAHIP